MSMYLSSFQHLKLDADSSQMTSSALDSLGVFEASNSGVKSTKKINHQAFIRAY